MRRKQRANRQSIQGTAMLPKDITTHNQTETLTQLFMLLVGSLNPAIVPRMDSEPTIVPSALGPGVKTSIETALISVCNRISDLAQEPKRWATEDAELVELYKMSLVAGIQNAEAGKKAAEAIQALSKMKSKSKDKGPSDESK
jgi:hypothetical protein